VEGFLLQCEVQRVVIEFDHRGLAGTENDARHLARIAQAAARSGPLLAALESDEFHDTLQ
jgi:hypothetical protein